MNVRADVEVRREPTGAESWPRASTVTVSIECSDVRRGEAIVGALEQAWKGAREVVKTTLDGTR